uniref:Uncharacterized protein n=1 Tax=Panstrongylus lignarius TaxID=156445 RepID=A0A224Y4D5_9HEMI
MFVGWSGRSYSITLVVTSTIVDNATSGTPSDHSFSNIWLSSILVTTWPGCKIFRARVMCWLYNIGATLLIYIMIRSIGQN